jgi:hypothetical protein
MKTAARARFVTIAVLLLGAPLAGADIVDDVVNMPAKLQAAAKAMDAICSAGDVVGAAGGLATSGQPGAFGPLAQLAYLQSVKSMVTSEVDKARSTLTGEIAQLRALSGALANAESALKIIAREAEAKRKGVRSQLDGIQAQKQAVEAEFASLRAQLAQKQKELAAQEKEPWLGRTFAGGNARIAALNAEIAALEAQLAPERTRKAELASDFALKQSQLAAIDAEEQSKAAPHLATLSKAAGPHGESPATAISRAPSRIAKREETLMAVNAAGAQAAGCLQTRIDSLTKSLGSAPGGSQRGDAGPSDPADRKGSSVDWAAIDKATSDFQGAGAPAGGNAPQSSQEQPSGYRQGSPLPPGALTPGPYGAPVPPFGPPGRGPAVGGTGGPGSGPTQPLQPGKSTAAQPGPGGSTPKPPQPGGTGSSTQPPAGPQAAAQCPNSYKCLQCAEKVKAFCTSFALSNPASCDAAAKDCPKCAGAIPSLQAIKQECYTKAVERCNACKFGTSDYCVKKAAEVCNTKATGQRENGRWLAAEAWLAAFSSGRKESGRWYEAEAWLASFSSSEPACWLSRP